MVMRQTGGPSTLTEYLELDSQKLNCFPRELGFLKKPMGILKGPSDMISGHLFSLGGAK